MFLEISQNSQESTCSRVSFLIKLLRPAILLKKRLWHRSFPVNFVRFLRTSFLQNTSGQLLLSIAYLNTLRTDIDVDIDFQSDVLKFYEQLSCSQQVFKFWRESRLVFALFDFIKNDCSYEDCIMIQIPSKTVKVSLLKQLKY